MQSIGEIKRIHDPINASRRCHECDEEALGRCPDCHFGFCQDHFPKQQHAPCAEKQIKLVRTQVCYVCGAQIYPDQWSLSKTAHVVDEFICHGCNRYICDELHTKYKTESLAVIREGLRGHRYQYINRYCDLCAPFNNIGGIKGFTQVIIVIATLAATIFFFFHP
jgi:hypothetical protein